MSMIPIHVIAFFIAVMTVPEGTEQFTMDVKGKTILWTQEGVGWRAVEQPRDDWGLHTITGSQVTITGEGHTLKTNMSRFLSVPEEFDREKADTIPVAFKQLGTPVAIQRETGKIVLSQAKGVLFEKPVTITWQTAGTHEDSKAGSESVHFTPQILDKIDRDLSMIDAAKQQWAIQSSKSLEDEPTPDDIDLYFTNGMPKPPFGATYVLNRVDTPPEIRLPPEYMAEYKKAVLKAEKERFSPANPKVQVVLRSHIHMLEQLNQEAGDDELVSNRIARLKQTIAEIEQQCIPAKGTRRQDVEAIFGAGCPLPLVPSKLPPQTPPPPDSPRRAYSLCENGTLEVRYDSDWKVLHAHYVNPYSTKGAPTDWGPTDEQLLNELESRLSQLEKILTAYKHSQANPPKEKK